MRPGPNGRGLSRKAVMTEVDRATPLEETLEALHDLVKGGTVRYLGASSMPAWEFAKALYLQRQHGWARFAS
jgi:aryl-alcohol dehydrogenase-like predicted oxidoreductase